MEGRRVIREAEKWNPPGESNLRSIAHTNEGNYADNEASERCARHFNHPTVHSAERRIREEGQLANVKSPGKLCAIDRKRKVEKRDTPKKKTQFLKSKSLTV